MCHFYFQEKPVPRNRLQLLGVTAMLLSSKYEEMFAPEVADFVYITDNAYTKADIREMERDILRTLNFSFGKPLCLHFLRRDSKAGQVKCSLVCLILIVSANLYSVSFLWNLCIILCLYKLLLLFIVSLMLIIWLFLLGDNNGTLFS